MKKALTIGELLITMAIIGVIATLVLPGFLKDYHKKLHVTKLKKTVEAIEVAINQACIDNNVSYFNQTIYSKYVSGGGNQQAFLDKYFKNVGNVTSSPFNSKYRTVGNNSENTITFANSGWAKLASGEAVSFFCYTKTNCHFRLDVNSTDGPNVGGRDFFVVNIDPDTNQLYNGYPTAGCTTNFKGEGCFGLLLENNWEVTY